ncbi:hypothetical protein KSD_49480 [Ktedonobacter sp. SOSP1-85]|uniref:hypothetical protein n=1 Tax=Ktedonobacter sp. SOSP1-85 TaxID=2778367 RepID=UPI0019166CDD|nr:hypothetical protein [Ktedonobacter sp. SOSP1-85]GHO77177.1 hypothetical protein KSD_49480 [Ktedonobacter sp. SOSP1-85]
MRDPNQSNVPPQPGYPQGQYPPQPGYPQGQGRAHQRSTYQRRRHLGRFQVRIGSLGFIACAAGIYLLVTGRVKNPVAELALIGGGALVFVLFVLLPLSLRR